MTLIIIFIITQEGGVMKKVPEGVTLCNLEVILMPQGGIICNGRTVGSFKQFKQYLTKKEKKEQLRKSKKL